MPDFTGLVFERQCLVFKRKGLKAKLKKKWFDRWTVVFLIGRLFNAG